MTNSPILNSVNAKAIFQNKSLEEIFLRLENPKEIIDATEELAKLVNTGKSKSESLSRWVRYREGYSPAIVHKILEMFPIDKATEYVMDPMCGSGSTQVAAQQLTVPSAGTDVSPYAVLVSNVKTSQLSASNMQEIEAFVTDLKHTQENVELDYSNTELHLSQYFPSDNFAVLARIKRSISANFPNSSKVLDFLNVALLAIVEDCSNRKKDGNGLATRPAPCQDVLKLYFKQVMEMVEDSKSSKWLKVPSVSTNRSALEIDVSISEANKEFNKSLGAVIFSPPYANSFDYYESYKLELLFGDFFSLETIGDERKRLIRSYRQMGNTPAQENLPTVETLIDEIISRLPAKELTTGVRDGRSRLLPNMLRGYFDDMRIFLSKAHSGMPSGSYMAIVVDQSAYLGVLVPTDLILAEIAEAIGFTFEKLVICRKAKTSGQQMNMQPLLGEVLRETAVILRR